MKTNSVVMTILLLCLFWMALSQEISSPVVGPANGALVVAGGGVKDMDIYRRFYFLAPGDRFNLKTREPFRMTRKPEPLERVQKKSK